MQKDSKKKIMNFIKKKKLYRVKKTKSVLCCFNFQKSKSFHWNYVRYKIIQEFGPTNLKYQPPPAVLPCFWLLD